MGLRKEKMERRNWIQSVLTPMEELPVLRRPVVAMIQRFLANDDYGDDAGRVEETQLMGPSLQALSLHGYRIPDLVLEIILGQMFRNVHKVHEMYCAEFTLLR